MDATPALLATLDAVRSSVDELRKFVEHRVVSRGGSVNTVDANATRSTELLPASRYRHLAVIYNDSTATLYVALGPHAEADVWTVKLAAGDYYETPAGYTGPIHGMWSAVNGKARVTELN